MSNATQSKSVDSKEQTVREAMANIDIAKSLIPKETGKSSSLVGSFKLTNDPKLGAVLNTLPGQAQKIVKAMVEGINDKGIVTIDMARASEIEDYVVVKSSQNNVIGTYMPLLLGNTWSKGRGSDALRTAMGGNTFKVFTRV